MMNRMRQFLQRGDLTPDATTGDARTALDVEAARHAPSSTTIPVSLTTTLDPSAQLRAFRQLVGITKELKVGAPSTSGSGSSKRSSSGSTLADSARPASNVGLYARVAASETAARRSFTAWSLIINSCLGVQVVVAAALTAMGAANTNHTAITVFGAVNTVIAGFLTYLKGSGLPGRHKYYENSWRKVRETIEQRERDFSSAAEYGTALPAGQTLAKAVADIESLYRDTRTDIEVNTPDNYTSLTKQGGGRTPQLPRPPTGSQSGPSVLPPGTAPSMLALPQGDASETEHENEPSSLQPPEKAHLAPVTPAVDEAAPGDSKHELKPASSSVASS